MTIIFFLKKHPKFISLFVTVNPIVCKVRFHWKAKCKQYVNINFIDPFSSIVCCQSSVVNLQPSHPFFPQVSLVRVFKDMINLFQ